MNGHVIVRCGERLLALSTSTVVEVFRMVAIAARMPRAPRFCLGVVDVRGRLVPLFDLAARLGILPPRNEAALVDAHVVMVRDSVGEVGFAVDEVYELTDNAVEPLAAHGGATSLGPLAVGAVRASDGRLAPVVEDGALLSVLARRDLRAALAALEEQRA
jgi:purine-binding chemotaxis protein CheW